MPGPGGGSRGGGFGGGSPVAALEAAEALVEDLADLVFTADLALVRAMAFTEADAWAAL